MFSSSPHRILVAPDSFKGSLSAREAADAICEGLRQAFPDCVPEHIAVSDGGEGFTDAILSARGGIRVTVQVSDPQGRPVEAAYGLCGSTAVIETAAASGLPLLRPEERNPLLTTSFGTGELIRDALDRGCRDLLVGLGGSATHDAGTGMLSALGFRFLDASGRVLRGCGASLAKIAALDRSRAHPALAEASFTVACDVQTVFCGPQGAAATFAPQKGATPAMVRELEAGSCHFADLVLQQTGHDLREEKGTGAAGGLGGAFTALLGAQLASGIELVLDAADFDARLAGADLVITGEGCIDAQSAQGKVLSGILRHAQSAGVPVIAIGGRIAPDLSPDALPFAHCFALSDETVPDRLAMQPDYARARIIGTVGKLLPAAWPLIG